MPPSAATIRAYCKFKCKVGGEPSAAPQLQAALDTPPKFSATACLLQLINDVLLHTHVCGAVIAGMSVTAKTAALVPSMSSATRQARVV